MKTDNKIILLALICFVLGSTEFIIVGVLDKIAETIHISIPQAGGLISIFAVTAALGTPVAMYYLGRYNKRTVMALALVLIFCASLLMAAAPGYSFLLAARMIMALGVGIFNVICFIVASQLAGPDRKGRAIATVTIGFNAALNNRSAHRQDH